MPTKKGPSLGLHPSTVPSHLMTSPTLPCPVPYCLCHPQQVCHWTENPPTLLRQHITLFSHRTPHCSVLSFPSLRCPAVSPSLPASSCAIMQEIAKNVQCQGTKKKRALKISHTPVVHLLHILQSFSTPRIFPYHLASPYGFQTQDFRWVLHTTLPCWLCLLPLSHHLQ